MKKIIALALVLVCIFSLAACSSSNAKDDKDSSEDTNSQTEIKQDDTKVFGRIDAIDGEVFTLAIMENKSTDNICPLNPDSNSDNKPNTSENDNVLDDPNNNNTNGNVAQLAPDDADDVFLDYTGESKKVTIGKNTKVTYPNGDERPFSDLAVGQIIIINLDKAGGQIVSVMVIG